MQSVRIATLWVIALLTAIALAFWWAGFAPFPTDPVLLASYQEAGYCTVPSDNNWASCSPISPNTAPRGSELDFRLFPAKEGPAHSLLGAGYDQWGVEGFNGCWDDECSSIWHLPDLEYLRWTIYYDTQVPHFGFGRPSWVLVVSTSNPLDGVYAEAAYTTYAACMYRKAGDAGSDWYTCLQIEPAKPWVVGAIVR